MNIYENIYEMSILLFSKLLISLYKIQPSYKTAKLVRNDTEDMYAVFNFSVQKRNDGYNTFMWKQISV